MNKLEGITEIVLNLDELDNSNKLEEGTLSNTLLTYHVTSYDDSTISNPMLLSRRNLRMESLFL